MARRFATLDVFTTVRFAGNQLAVVLDTDGLDADAMQTIAREFNLSETVFVQAPAAPDHRARLRIFTTACELPFAGHPTVGSAVLLALLDGRDGPAAFVLEETIGAVRCRVRPAASDSGYAEFDVPRLPALESGKDDRGGVAAALGIREAEIGLGAWPVECWSAGNPFTFVPLTGLDAAQRCRVDHARFDEAFRGSGAAAAFVFCREVAGSHADFHARMFAPSMGPIEDPATGSAVAAFAGYLAVHGGYQDGEHLVRVEQGVEMGRPSLIELRLTLVGGRLTAASIGGNAVIASEGTLRG